MTKDTYYVPGMCNINPAEVAYRKKAFTLGLWTSVVVLPILLILNVQYALVAVIMFVPAWIGAIGYLQAKNKFCVGYAAAGQYNVSGKMGEVKQATDEQRKKDQARARTINSQALLIGVGSGVVCGVIAALI